jgi:hypothetical protein
MAERLITSKNAFFNVRPGTTGARRQQPATIDEARHPALARYAVMSGTYSNSPALPGLWQNGYNRFGDEFEALVSDISSRKPTEYAKRLLQLDDLWKLVGLRWEELRPEEQLAWEHARSDSRSRALPHIARRTTPERYPELLAWSGVNRIEFFHGRAWGEAIYGSAISKVAQGQQGHRFYYKSLMTEPRVEDLLLLAEAGVTPAELYMVVSQYGLTVEQARIHFIEGIAPEYLVAME